MIELMCAVFKDGKKGMGRKIKYAEGEKGMDCRFDAI
jgi:hypothetical protein